MEALDKWLRGLALLGEPVSNMTDVEWREQIELSQSVTPKEIPIVLGGNRVLSVADHESILAENPENEHVLIAYLTPHLDRLCQKVKMRFFNTEESKWIRTLLVHSENYQKPDALSCVEGLCDLQQPTRKELEDLREEIAGNNPSTFLFGRGIWALRDSYVIWEFKKKLEPDHRGTCYSYICHLCRNDLNSIYTVILGDSTDFYIIQGQGGIISSVRQSSWTAEGSADAILQTLEQKNSWMRLLQGICSQKKLSLDFSGDISAFLGSGGYGRCFRVRTSTSVATPPKSYALKIILLQGKPPFTESLVAYEFDLLTSLKDPHPNVVVVDKSSFTVFEEEGIPIGVGYLMETVGTPLTVEKCRQKKKMHQILESLQRLHVDLGWAHGDARWQNCMEIVNPQTKLKTIVWVDFIYIPVSDDQHTRKKKDIETLLSSLYPDIMHQGNLPELLEQYRQAPASFFMKQFVEEVFH